MIQKQERFGYVSSPLVFLPFFVLSWRIKFFTGKAIALCLSVWLFKLTHVLWLILCKWRQLQSLENQRNNVDVLAGSMIEWPEAPTDAYRVWDSNYVFEQSKGCRVKRLHPKYTLFFLSFDIRICMDQATLLRFQCACSGDCRSCHEVTAPVFCMSCLLPQSFISSFRYPNHAHSTWACRL